MGMGAAQKQRVTGDGSDLGACTGGGQTGNSTEQRERSADRERSFLPHFH